MLQNGLQNVQDEYYKDRMIWTLALLEVQSKDYDHAKKTLGQVKENYPTWKNQAAKLLEKIE